MLRTLAHRGPDDEHLVAGPDFALGSAIEHRRRRAQRDDSKIPRSPLQALDPASTRYLFDGRCVESGPVRREERVLGGTYRYAWQTLPWRPWMILS